MARLLRILPLLSFLAASFSANAQTLKGIFGADVDQGHRSAQYRIGVTDDRGEGEAGFAHRIHYQQAFSEQYQVRGVLAQSERGDDGLEFRYFRVEQLFQFLENEEAGWDSALRLDLQVAEGDDTPGFVRLGWAGQFALAEAWRLRLNWLSGRDIQSGADESLTGEGRVQLSYKTAAGPRLGFDYYASLGDLDALGSFREQNHLAGPFVSGGFGDGYSLRLQALFGVSSSATDNQFRIFLGKRF